MARIFRTSRSARLTTVIGALTLIAALVLVTAASAGAASSRGAHSATQLGTQNVALHNNTTGSVDCPSNVGPSTSYWHFVIAPNNGRYSFATITLNVGGTTFVFTGSQIIPNGTQTDNVFVEVPAGHALTDLRTSGSSADITPAAPTPKRFNLSGTCAGSGQTTTSTEVPATTTTSGSTSTTTPETTTSTTVPTTTTTSPETTSTTVPSTTTTSPETTSTTVPPTTTPVTFEP